MGAITQDEKKGVSIHQILFFNDSRSQGQKRHLDTKTRLTLNEPLPLG